MKKDLIAKLKQMKQRHEGGNPDARWLASNRETLLMQIRNTVGEAEKPSFKKAAGAFIRLMRPDNMTRAVAMPLAVVLLMFGTWTGGSALVNASRDTLPGETLYSVKRLSERVSLRLASGTQKTERHLEIAGRRLNEMARLTSGSGTVSKEEKVSVLADRFAFHMNAVKEGLADLGASGEAETAVMLALAVDAKTDQYQQIFEDRSFSDLPSLRLALLSLDQVSIGALELLVEKRNVRPDALAEAQLTANVERGLATISSRVAKAQDALGGDASISTARIDLTAQAQTAVEEAKELYAQGDFQAAVKKIVEGSELVAEAETAEDAPEPSDAATNTDETSESDDAPEEDEARSSGDEGASDDETSEPVDTSDM